MIEFVDRAALALVSELVASGARSFVVAGVAAAALAAFRPKATSLRLFTWTAVLYSSLALPLLGWVLPPLQISAPRFLQGGIVLTPPDGNAGDGQSEFRVETSLIKSSSKAKLSASDTLPLAAKKPSSSGMQGAVSERHSFVWTAFSWNLVVAWIYVVGTLFFLTRFAAGIVFSRKLVRGSQRITETLAGTKLASSARLATSDCISVPVTVGISRPTILLPSDWHEWEVEKLDAVLAHEFSHVERRDPLTQCMSLLYRAIFWFNPLAWWMNRHLAALAEQASDEAALSGGADQSRYARTLLGFFEVLQTAPRRIRWQGVSIARPGQAEQRLERILAWKGTVTMNVKKSFAVAIVVLAIPVIYLAASVRPAHSVLAASNAGMSQAPSAPAAPPAPPVGGVSAVAPIAGVPAMTPMAPVAPMAPEAREAPLLAPEAPAISGYGQSHSSGSGSGKGFSYAYGFDDEERFVIATGKSDSFTMSGSTQDARHVEKLKKQIPGDFIWFQRDEKSYIIRDQATIDRARGFWAGQEELGKKQEELGKQQETLGKQQEELGAKMEQVRVNVPDMTAALDKLKAKLQKLGPSATMEQIGDLQSEIGELQSKIGEIQSHAGEEQSKLGELQGELGEKQGKLGEQQGKLGEQQAEIAEKATRQMKELLDEAIKNGTAKPEEETIKTPTL